MMDRICIFRSVKRSRFIIQRTKYSGGLDRHIICFPNFFCAKPISVFIKRKCILLGDKALHPRSRPAVGNVAFHIPPKVPAGSCCLFLPKSKSGCNKSRTLRRQIALVFQQRIQGSHQFHVRVQVDPSVLKNHFQAGIIAYKRPSFFLISFLCKITAGNIEVVLIPLTDLVVGAVFLPTGDASFCQVRQRPPPNQQ